MKPALRKRGCQFYAGCLTEANLADLGALFRHLPDGRPGHRLSPASVAGLPAVETVRRVAATHIGEAARPVRILLFDKREGGNWALGWHQDRTIEVREQRDVPGFGSWLVKQGRAHVAPPISLLERMVTARLHLDAVDDQNAPLIVAPGSHRVGLVPEAEIERAVSAAGSMRCLASAGDVWLYATMILHASDRAAPGRRRRVVQIDFSADMLPGGLAWADAA